MAQERVSRQELRDLHIGQTRIFVLTDAKKIEAARIACLQLKREEGLEYQVKRDFAAKAVSITRIK